MEPLWLAGAHAVDGGLGIPGSTGRLNADLTLRVDNVALSSGALRVPLEWDEFRPFPAVAHPESAVWQFMNWSSDGRGQGYGIALALQGDCEDRSSELLSRLTGSMLRLRPHRAIRSRVPLWSTRLFRLDRSIPAERATVSALCHLCVDDESVRTRLDDRDRVVRLVADMQNDALTRYFGERGMSSSSTQIERTMRSLGYVHRIDNRPLPGDQRPSLEEATERVRQAIADDPLAYKNGVDASHVRRLLKADYLDVAPWPFAALLD